MKNISKYASEFSKIEFGHQLAGQIPWFTIVTIISKSRFHDEMLWYFNQTHEKGGIKNE